MLAQAIQQPTAQNGLRPFHPLRDLRRVADLIEIVFREEMAFAGEGIVAEMRRMASWGPLLYLLMPVDALMAGFVWEEGGQVVANVSLSQPWPDRQEWLISNVAVHPTYRRRGIARQLMEAALDSIALRGGGTALLQVREENEAALRLYEQLGFTRIGVKSELMRSADAAPCAAAPGDVGWRKYQARHRRAVQELVEASVSPELRPHQPTFYGSFPSGTGRSWLDRWDDVLSSRRTHKLVVAEGERVLAFLEAQATRGREAHHRLFWALHEEARGRLELSLAQQGVALLATRPSHAILLLLPASDEASLAAASACGFAEVRRLTLMKLKVS